MSWVVERRKQALKRWALMRGWAYIEHWLGRAGRLERQIGGETVRLRRSVAGRDMLEAMYTDGLCLSLRWNEGKPVTAWVAGWYA